MNLYVCEGLEKLKNQLEERGYNTNVQGNDQYDAIICNIKDIDLTSLSIINNIKHEGTLIIDAGSKSIDDIEYILYNRSYSSLFWYVSRETMNLNMPSYIISAMDITVKSLVFWSVVKESPLMELTTAVMFTSPIGVRFLLRADPG